MRSWLIIKRTLNQPGETPFGLLLALFPPTANAPKNDGDDDAPALPVYGS
jgi:hypothetical protein